MFPKIQMKKTVPKAWTRKVINPDHQYKSVKLDEGQYMEKKVKKQPKNNYLGEEVQRFNREIERKKY